LRELAINPARWLIDVTNCHLPSTQDSQSFLKIVRTRFEKMGPEPDTNCIQLLRSIQHSVARTREIIDNSGLPVPLKEFNLRWVSAYELMYSSAIQGCSYAETVARINSATTQQNLEGAALLLDGMSVFDKGIPGKFERVLSKLGEVKSGLPIGLSGIQRSVLLDSIDAMEFAAKNHDAFGEHGILEAFSASITRFILAKSHFDNDDSRNAAGIVGGALVFVLAEMASGPLGDLGNGLLRNITAYLN
jgi:hypothetical protein